MGMSEEMEATYLPSDTRRVKGVPDTSRHPHMVNGMPQRPYDITSAIIAYEQGDLDDSETVELFQHLIEAGLVHRSDTRRCDAPGCF